jgi:hypothetical protein
MSSLVDNMIDDDADDDANVDDDNLLYYLQNGINKRQKLCCECGR